MPFFNESMLIAKSKRSILSIWEDETEQNNLIITFNSSINCYEDNKYGLLKSWGTKKGFEITCGAVFSPIESEFVFVLNKNIIATVYTQDYSQSSTFKQKMDIVKILPNGKLDPLVLFEDGSLYTTAECMANPQSIKRNSNLDLINKHLIGCFCFAIYEQCIVCLVVQENDGMKLNICKIPVDNTGASYLSISLNICGNVTSCTSYTGDNNSPYLAVLFDNGDMHSIQISANSEGGFDANLKHILNIEVFDDSQLLAIGENKVAVLCKQNIVKVIGMELGAVVATLPLNTRLKNVQLFSSKQLMIVKTSSMINAYSYTQHETTLANIVVNQETVKETNVDDVIGEDDLTQNDKTYNEDTISENKMEDNKWDFNVSMKTLLHTINVENFDTAWQKLWESSSSILKIQIVNSAKMRHVLQRFGTDDKEQFWPRDTILKMVQTKHFPGRLFVKVINKALGQPDWEFILNFLKNVSNIPEEILVTILQHIFKTDHDNVTKNDVLSACVDTVIGLSFSSNVLKTKLQSLEIDVVIQFIKYIQSKIENSTTLSKNPTLDNLVLWMSCVLDAHLSSMILSEDCWPLIESVQQTVKYQMEIFRELNLIGIYYDQIKSKMVFQTNTEYTKYIVHNMYL